MKPKLLDYLVCIECKRTFDLLASQTDGEEILEGALSCSECALTFPITNGIPRIFSSELEDETKNTVQNFGWQWNNLDPGLQQTEFDSESVFLDFIEPVEREFFVDKVVLDAGCGAGRFAILSSKFGASEVIGIDLSSAVEIAYEKTRHIDNVHIVQTDIYNLPFLREFNFIYSLGVLHHLPDPRRGFISLSRHLNDSGAIAFWVYGRENNEWYLNIVDPIRKKITSKMSSRTLAFVCHCITIPIYPILKLIYSPINKYKRLHGLKKILFYNRYLSFLSRFGYSAIHAVIFDQLTPQISHYLPKSEIESWLDSETFRECVITSRNGNSWRGLGRDYKVMDRAGASR